MYMALHITNREVEAKVRTLASVTGESITDAIGAAVDERLRRAMPAHRMQHETVDSILALVRSYKLRSINNGLTEDEILGYGPNGYCE
jgi:hypothetical protein